MDIITAQRLVEGTEEGLRKCSRDFEGVDEFVKWADEELLEEEDCELPEKRIKERKGCQESWQMMSSWHQLIPTSRYTMSL